MSRAHIQTALMTMMIVAAACSTSPQKQHTYDTALQSVIAACGADCSEEGVVVGNGQLARWSDVKVNCSIPTDKGKYKRSRQPAAYTVCIWEARPDGGWADHCFSDIEDESDAQELCDAFTTVQQQHSGR